MDEESAKQLLKKYSSDEKSFQAVLGHSQAVKKIALRIAIKINESESFFHIDTDFIATAAILHDIGRFKCSPGPASIKHGIEGGKILRGEGLDEHYARVCERHLGAGITKKEISEKNLPLPMQDFLPETAEEKIITYADNLIAGEKEIPVETAIKRFTKEIDEQAGNKVKELHEEINHMMER